MTGDGPASAPSGGPVSAPSGGSTSPPLGEPSSLGRRDFLRLLGAGAGALAAGACAPRGASPGAPYLRRGIPDVAVVGAGAFGGWTAYWLRELGADVVLIDKYGPGNSRATSGGETRGVRSSYGDRPHGPLWARWAKEAIRRWSAWDEEWGHRYLPRLFFTTGDLIFRAEWEPFLENSAEAWRELGAAYEVLDPEEVAYRWPVFDLTDIGTVLYEPDAGVVRARRAMESVAEVFRRRGGEVRIAEAAPGPASGPRLSELRLASGGALAAGRFVFALGPWLPTAFPEVIGNRIRVPMGHVYYFGTPPGNGRYVYPNLPSWNFRGVTGWAALPPDHRGFRVRTGGRAPADPDTTERAIDPEFHAGTRDFLAERFPGLENAPILETRACHYELSVTRNFIIDRHPEWENVWIAGGGSAEAFKFGPVSGEYVARRVLDRDREPQLAEGFRIPEEEFEEPEGRPLRYRWRP